MRERKVFVRVVLAVVTGLVLAGAVLAVWQNRDEGNLTAALSPDEGELVVWQNLGEGNLTLKKIAYDYSTKDSVVYIKENGEYVPYLVLTSDYGGNVLLLRENLLPEPMQYKLPPPGEEYGPLGVGYDYSAYYEESSIDEFLNTDFPEVFSPEVQAAIVDTMIEVTDMDRYEEWNYATHMLRRKVFLLSAVELGDIYSVDLCTASEGIPLKYFVFKEHSVKTAYMADGEAWPYWTRTPWLSGTYSVMVIGVHQLADATTDRYLGVRPAFCMARDIAVLESDSIVAGETVYVLEMEGE